MDKSGMGRLCTTAARTLLLPLFGALLLNAPLAAQARNENRPGNRPLIQPENGSGNKPDKQERAGLLTRITVTGNAIDTDTSDTGSFAGRLTVTGLLLDQSGELTVQAFLTGLVSGVDIGSTQVIAQIFSTSGSLTRDEHGRCESLDLELGAIHLPLVGLIINLEEIELDIAGETGQGRLLGNLLCSLTRLLDSPDHRQKAAHLIDRINDLIGGLVFAIPVAGDLRVGSFTGFLTIRGVAVNPAGELVIFGVLSGVAETGAHIIPFIEHEFHVVATLRAEAGTGAPVAACETLWLDPQRVALAGAALELDLDEIRIGVAELRGENRRLGTLLCALARALESDAPSLHNIVRQINAIIFF